jgi:DNA-binding NarL/FixJ family response regulator
MIRVLVVDDQDLVQQGLKALIGNAPDVTLVGQASTAHEMLSMAARLHPDVILMDPRLGSLSVTRAAAESFEAQAGWRIVAFIGHASQDIASTCLQAGALSYVMKDSDPNKILNALRSAAGVLDLTSSDDSSITLRQESDQTALTARESEILKLVALGQSNRQVSERLGIAIKTVESHLSSCYSKIGVSNRSLAALWTREHLEPLPSGSQHRPRDT